MAVKLRFSGSNCLRQRIILSLLTSKHIIIEDIRPDDGGLQAYESNLLDLVTLITSGTKVIKTANRLIFEPGTIIGGEFIHACHLDRSIAYYLEVLLFLAPFCKKPLCGTLTGITNEQIDPNVDDLKASALPVLKKFIGDVDGTKLELKINARGFKPDGGGQVVLTCPVVKQLQPVQFTNMGKVKRIRGVAVAARVSPQMANRLIDVSKGMLLKYLPDVYIYSDHNKGKTSGLSPGFALSLSAETTEGCIYTASTVSNSKGSGKGPTVPEDLASETTNLLFSEINRGGCIDSVSQSLALVLMAFNQNDVSTLKLGPLTSYSILFLRHIKEFCGLTFKLESNEENGITATCVGIGFKNLSKPTY